MRKACGEYAPKSLKPVPRAEDKRVWTPIEETIEQVTEEIAQQAIRRGPKRALLTLMNELEGAQDRLVTHPPMRYPKWFPVRTGDS